MSNNYVADFDSSSAMLRAIARGIAGREFRTLGVRSPLELLAPILPWLPDALIEQLYIWAGAAEAAPAEEMGRVDAEAISRWVASEYPPRQFPAAFVGSSNGAMVHLAVALGAPFLPQTFLIPVRRSGVHPDDPIADMEWGMGPGRSLLAANPQLQLHHMHDANQDRLMVQRMTYFRVKRRALGEAYRNFLLQRLAPGATIYVVDCGLHWPVTTVAARHYFQLGATGGLTSDEYQHGSRRVEAHLAHHGSPTRRWPSPATDDEQPEAEWGFEPALLDDLVALAEQRGVRLCRMTFDEPEDLSPLVADLHRWWYRQRGLHPRRLVVDSFILMEPFWTLRTTSVPWWSVFPVEQSTARLAAYLDERETFDEIGVLLFNHGTESAGLAKLDAWRSILARAARQGYFLGVDGNRFPRDFGTLRSYHRAMRRLRPVAAIPDRLAPAELESFIAAAGDRYAVRLEELVARRKRPLTKA